MKFTYRLRVPRIDIEGYRKTLDRHMREMVAQGITEWLDAVLPEIPVWSGASKATFIKLARLVGNELVVVPRRIDRTGIGEAESVGSVDFDKGQGRYTFTYATTLPWLIWNEYHNANIDPDPTLFYRVIKEGPYHFQEKGRAAFVKFAQDVQLPSVRPYVKAQPVKS